MKMDAVVGTGVAVGVPRTDVGVRVGRGRGVDVAGETVAVPIGMPPSWGMPVGVEVAVGVAVAGAVGSGVSPTASRWT
jgi:hypothetical protein